MTNQLKPMDKARLAGKTVDITASGTEGVYGGLAVYCPQAQVGILYNRAADQPRVIARLLKRAEELLGEPVMLGELTDITAEGQMSLIDDDERIEPLERKRKRKRKPRQSVEVYWYGDLGE